MSQTPPIRATSVADTAVAVSAAPLRRWRNRIVWSLPSILLLAVLGVLIVYPIGMLAYASLIDVPPRPGAPPASFTSDNYARLLLPGNLRAMLNSVIVGLGGTALAVAIGGTLAWLGARTDVPARRLVQLAGIVPLFVSPLVGALAWSFLASPRAGYLNVILRDLGLGIDLNVYSLAGIVFVSALYHAPFAFLLLAGALALINPELEEAARAHGASGRRTVLGVTFPLVKPALFGASTLTLVLILENFPIPEILGAPARITVVPSQIFRLMNAPAEPNVASAFGMALMVVLVGLVFAQNRLLRGRDFATVTGKGFKPRQVALGRWRWLGLGVALVYLLCAVVLPFLGLLLRAVSRTGFFADAAAFVDVSQMTLANFTETVQFDAFQVGLKNTLIVAVATAVLGGLLHYVVAHFVKKTTRPGRRLMEYIAVAPIAIPGLVIGLGYLWGWIVLPLPLFGTLAILVLGYSARLTPFGFRSMTGTINQVSTELEESARIAGAGRVRTTLSVTFPLLRPGLVSMGLLLFIMSFQEISLSLFLFTSDTRVLTIVMLQQWVQGETAKLAVMSLITSGVLLLVAAIGSRWLRFREV